MGYRATWNSTDQVPQRAIDEGLIDRFGAIDTTDGGDTYRYSGSFEWQRIAQQRHRPRSSPTASATTSICSRTSPTSSTIPSTAISFTRPITGSSPAARSAIGASDRWAGREVQNTVGVQLRNDDITNVGLYHTEARAAARHDPPGRGAADERRRLTRRTKSAWTPWLRTLAGLRVDGYRFRVDASDPENGGTDARRHRQPERRRRLRPVQRHRVLRQRRPRLSQQRRARRDDHARSGRPARPSIRSRRWCARRAPKLASGPSRMPHLQTSLTLWTLSLGVGAGVRRRRRHDRSEPAEPSLRRRIRQLLHARGRG